MKEKDNIRLIRIIGNKKFYSDSFVCNKCGCRMILKVMGNSTSCKVSGCSGTMYRVD